MEEWQRVASEKEDDGLEKKSVDSRNDYGDSNEDSYQQQILEKTRLAFAAHAAQQLTNIITTISDTQHILKNLEMIVVILPRLKVNVTVHRSR